ncbi:MAG: YbbR-like domain-containing protein [Bacteroidia bacterium]|nr:YbbR-like domain-containing protein [Bacteroidia bacterium]
MPVRRKSKYAYLNISKKIKNFLLSDNSRELLIFLLFFVVASGFWLIQTLNNDYETDLAIPVKLINVPDNVVLTYEPASTLLVRVKDRGTILLNYRLGKTFFPIQIDFKAYKQRNNLIRIYANQLENQVLSQLNLSTKLLAIKPDTLDYIYSMGRSKKVPVHFGGTVKAGNQYYISDTVCSPESVLVYAPPGVLDTITKVYTERLFLDNLVDTVRQSIALRSTKGVKFIPDRVHLTFPVDVYAEKTVDVPLNGVDFPPGKVLRAFPSTVQVTFQVGVSRFRQIDADDFVINVSYKELMTLGSEKYKVRLQSWPRNITLMRIAPEKVDFLIEQISTE